MFDYLEKFNKLSKELRGKISAPVVMNIVDELENKYGVDLAAVVMKIMVKDISILNLVIYFVDEFKLDRAKAEELAGELKEKVFFDVREYLGIKQNFEIKSREIENFEKAARKEKKEILPEPTARESSYILTKRETSQKVKPSLGIKSEIGAGVQSESGKSQISNFGAGTRSGSGANFFFSPEDEEEIRELTNKIDGKFDNGKYNEHISEKLEKIIKQVQINFGSEQLLIRFKRIIETYLRGVRDKIETKQTLIKPFSDGGLNFDRESTNKILLIAKGEAKDLDSTAIKPPNKIRLPVETIGLKRAGLENVGIRDVDYNLESLKKNSVSKRHDYKKGEIERRNKIKKLDIEHELAPPPPRLQSADKILVPVKNKHKKATQDDVDTRDRKRITQKDNKIKLARRPNLNIRRSFEQSGKKKMEDVKFVPKIMNPIDELRYMDLINFRRLDSDPADRAQKIEEKISLLEEASYSKRMEGIKAWRRSPVNKLYLKIGQQSINEEKPIDVIIEDRKISKQDYLSVKEFNAIMDMNNSLRF